MIQSLRARARRMSAFMRANPSPFERAPLALLGWARDNPSSAIARWFPSARVRPLALEGGSLTVSTRDLGQLVSFEEVFVERTYELSRVPFVPTLIIDCGAHVGFFSALAAATYPRVPMIAFEPNPANLAWLQGNLWACAGPVTIHPAAVSTGAGVKRFSAAESNAGSLQDAGSPGVDVRVFDLAEMIPRHPDAAVLLKMDIEGEERRLLPHLVPVLPRRCAIFVETHDGGQALTATTQLLADAGFAVTKTRERDRFADVFASRA